jgi:DNA-binding response OmpR family regulator
VDREELVVRAERLLARANPPAAPAIEVDADGVVRCGDRIAILGPQEAVLLRILVATGGALVARSRLVEQLWPGGAPHDPRALDNRVKVLRQHLRSLPVRIHTVRGRGFLLEVAAGA